MTSLLLLCYVSGCPILVRVLAVVNIPSVYSVSTSWSLSLVVPFVSDAAVGPSVAVL